MASIATIQQEFHLRLALLQDGTINAAPSPSKPTTSMTAAPAPQQSKGTGRWESLLGLSPDAAHARRREWNRGPLTDLFPRIPPHSLERILDLCIAKDFTFDLSRARLWNARRYTAIAVAHVRHEHSDYDDLLRRGVERFEARRRSGPKVWKVLREWCPWDSSNEVLEKCFQATLIPLEQRAAEYAFVDDPMDIDSESDFGGDAGRTVDAADHPQLGDWADDPMEID